MKVKLTQFLTEPCNAFTIGCIYEIDGSDEEGVVFSTIDDHGERNELYAGEFEFVEEEGVEK